MRLRESRESEDSLDFSALLRKNGKLPDNVEFNESLELLRTLEKQYEAIVKLFTEAITAMQAKKRAGEVPAMRVADGTISFRSVDNEWHDMPTFPTIAEAVAKNIDFYREKAQAGFNTLCLAPTGLSFKEIYKIVQRFLSEKMKYLQVSDHAMLEDNEHVVTSTVNNAQFPKSNSPAWSVSLRKTQLGDKVPDISIKTPGPVSAADSRNAIKIADVTCNEGEDAMTLEGALMIYLDILSNEPLPADAYHNIVVRGTKYKGEVITIMFDRGEPDCGMDPSLNITTEAAQNLVPEDMIQKVVPIVIQSS